MQSPSILLTIGAFLLLLGPLVVIHELGHYLVGRLFGVQAEAFSIGIGKELWHRIDRRGTRWRIAALPVGGYVMFAGDADPSSRPDLTAAPVKGTMHGAALWQRALIVLAGPFANWLVAALIFAGFAYGAGIMRVPPVVDRFAPQSAAQVAGIQLGDRIVAIDGDRIDDFSQIADKVMLYPGHRVVVSVDRGGQAIEIPVTLALATEKDRFGNELKRGLLGIGAGERYEVIRPGPLGALGEGVRTTGRMLRMVTVGLKQIVTGERSVSELGGPARTAKASGEALSLGWLAFVWFAGFVSINLAFINLLPIPTLDGGHLVIYAAEAVRRRPLGSRSQEWAFRTGLAIVLGVAVFVTFNDLVMLFFK